MKPRDRDAGVCRRILREVDDVDSFLDGHSEEDFLASTLMQKAAVMSLLNIGELTKAFTDEFIDATPWMPWQDMRSVRNVAAHTYEALDMRDVWETYRVDLPQLRKEMDTAIWRLSHGWDPVAEAKAKEREKDNKKKR